MDAAKSGDVCADGAGCAAREDRAPTADGKRCAGGARGDRGTGRGLCGDGDAVEAGVPWSAERADPGKPVACVVLLGFDPPCPDTIRKYMVKHKGGTDKSQSWLTFLRNHLEVSWAMDF